MTWVSGPSGGGEILRNLQEVRLELPAVGAEATGEDENQPILNWWCCVKGVGAKVLVVERMDWKSRMGLCGLMMQGSDMLIRGALHICFSMSASCHHPQHAITWYIWMFYEKQVRSLEIALSVCSY